MADFIDIATSLYTNSLTLFVGTGFSKFLTNGEAPNWLELIVDSTKFIDTDGELAKQLFKFDEEGNITEAIFELTVCAQILEIEYKKKKKDLKEEISEIIKRRINSETIDKDKLQELQEFFKEHPNINIITTNYDTLFSDYIIPLTSRVIIEGSTVPRINSGQNIYHIHGCVSKPNSLVLTLNDYYNFQNSNNYFSRKFYTLLQETTVAILGYSLGDFNLNTILSEVKNSRKESFRKTDIYYVSKDLVTNLLVRFYSTTYGIRVIQRKQINKFFYSIEENYDKAKELIDSVEDLKDVMNGTKEYSDDFLKLRVSISNILVQAANVGVESNNDNFLRMIIEILNRKMQFTYADGAWSQYEHLADWLLEIASTVIIRGTEIETIFCEVAKYSFSRCSKIFYYGYSWYAWKEWHSRWHEMKVENQIMLQELIQNNSWDKFTDVSEIYK